MASKSQPREMAHGEKTPAKELETSEKMDGRAGEPIFPDGDDAEERFERMHVRDAGFREAWDEVENDPKRNWAPSC